MLSMSVQSNYQVSNQEGERNNGNESIISGFVFAELVVYIEEACMEEYTVPVFKLSGLAYLPSLQDSKIRSIS